MHNFNLFSYLKHICLNIQKKLLVRKINLDNAISDLYTQEKKNSIEIKKILRTDIKTKLNFEKELKEIKEQRVKKQIEMIKATINKIINFFNFKRIIELKNSQSNIKALFHFLSAHITNYKQALHDLVEGHREVTHNKKFKFENGETVKDRMDKVIFKFRNNFIKKLNFLHNSILV